MKSNQKGFSLVELLVVVIIIGIIAAIAIPSLLASRRVANEASAVGSMRTFHSAQVTYYALNSPNSYAGDAGDLSDAKLIDSAFANAIDAANVKKGGYDWTYALVTAQTYTLNATSGAGSNQKSYFVNEEGVIRYKDPAAVTGDGQAAAVGDNPIQ